MDIPTLTTFFMWCTILNVGLLMFWSFWILAAPDFIYGMHRKWFPISREAFNLAMCASFLGIFKIFVIVFCIVPYVALLIMG